MSPYVASDDAPIDLAHATYLHARTRNAKAEALAALLNVADAFIRRIVRHFSRGPIRDIEPEDAMQQARIGFVVAAERCDTSKGPLRPYAIQRIQHELQTLAEHSVGIKIPRRAGLPAHVLREIELTWSQSGRELTAEELGEHANGYASLGERPRIVTSFDAPAVNGRHLNETIGHDAHTAEGMLLARDTERRSSRAARLVSSALSRPAVPTPRKIQPMPAAHPPNPLETLAQAYDGAMVFLGTMKEEEAKARRNRENVEAELKKMGFSIAVESAPPPLPIAKLPIIALNQSGPRHELVAFMRIVPEASLSQLVEASGATLKATRWELGKLRASGLVVVTGKARRTRYSLAKGNGP